MAAIKVLVVDDSVVVRRLVADVLGQDPDIEVVGTAVNGRAALAKVEQLRPDLVTMDIEMPELDGVAAVRELRRLGNRTPIIMFSTLTERGAVATLDALAAGASDYVTKPANVGSVSQSMEQVRSSLVPKILALVPRAARTAGAVPAPRTGSSAQSAPSAATPAPRAVAPVQLAARRRPAAGYELLVVGCSTGGPEALTTFLASLPPLRVPVAVVQHMPAVFTRQFAARLDRLLPFRVVEATDGLVLSAGDVAIAAGDFHLRVHRANGRLVSHLTQDAPENYCRPAVDVLFRTAVAAHGAGVLAVVLTGMGQDGCAGARQVVDAGGSVLVQDRETSVVWGMPGAVATAGLAEEVLPLAALGPAVAARLAPTRDPLRAGGRT
jgi:two-component system chemotaxis response regulator CheB